jgi:hypothetical protein
MADPTPDIEALRLRLTDPNPWTLAEREQARDVLREVGAEIERLQAEVDYTIPRARGADYPEYTPWQSIMLRDLSDRDAEIERLQTENAELRRELNEATWMARYR